MFALMTLSEIFRKYLHELGQLYSQNEASQITSIAFDSLAGLQRADVVKDPSMIISGETLGILENALLRLKKHEPIQHVTGQAWFCDLAFKVTRDVLVPRPETEELVMLASAFIKGQRLGVLDIGTGSGCIPIALQTMHANIACTAIDISTEALAIAKHNADVHKCSIQFKLLDFLNESCWSQLEQVDVIMSNPPYIPDTDKKTLDKNVLQFEPHEALFEPAGQPLIFYHKIAEFGIRNLKAGGNIFVEIHEDFGKEVLKIFSNAGYQAELKKDMFGKERFMVGRISGLTTEDTEGFHREH